MAAFDFPSSPSVNQTYTANGVTWKWNGTMWMRVSGAGYLEKIEEGNSKIEVDDSGSGNVTVTTDGTERLRVTSVGQMGLGTNSPNQKLHLHAAGSGGNKIKFTNDTTATGASDGFTVGIDGSENAELRLDEATNMLFVTNSTERLRITSGGNLQVKGGNLHLDSNAELALFEDNTSGSYTNSAKIAFDFSGNIARMRSSTNGSATIKPLAFYIANTPAIFIGTDGKVGINETSPTARLEVKSTGATAVFNSGAANDGRLEFEYNSSRVGLLAYHSDRLEIQTDSSKDFTIRTNGANERVRITSGGLVGVNCTPLSQFQVKSGTNQNIALSSMSSEAAIEAFNDAGSANVPLRLRGEDFKFYTSSTERLRITSDGKIGLDGMTNPVAKLHIGTEDDAALTVQTLFVEGAKTGYANYAGLPQNQLCLYDNRVSTAGSGGAIGFGANCGGSQQTWIAAIESQRDSGTNDASNYAGSIVFWTRPAQSTPTEKLRILSSGGITFNGDTAAANALDDYEEGSWTPVVTSNGTNPTYTVTGNYSYYIKIGRLVHFNVDFYATITSVGSGAAVYISIPFAVDNSTSNKMEQYVGGMGGRANTAINLSRQEIGWYYNGSVMYMRHQNRDTYDESGNIGTGDLRSGQVRFNLDGWFYAAS